MEPKFKNGIAVKLKDDVVYGGIYNGFTLEQDSAEKGKKYTILNVNSPNHEWGPDYTLAENGKFVGEDALELWSEPVSEIKFEPKTDGILEQLNTVGEQAKSEIDPQLFEIFKVIIGGFAANPSLCYDHQGDIVLPIEPAINFSKESLRLLREEKNPKQ